MLIALSWSLPSSPGEQAIVISTGEFGKAYFAYKRHWQIVTGPWLSELEKQQLLQERERKQIVQCVLENIDH